MSQDNLEIVRRAYAAIARGDWDAAFREAHPDFALTTKRGPSAGTHRRREEVEEFGRDYIEAFEDFAMEPEGLRESGDHVVAVVKRRARPKGGSLDIEVRNGHLWTLRDGKILSLESFPDPKDALAALDL